MEAVAIPTISTQEGGRMYQRTLQIGLETLVEEAKTSKLNNLHYMATTGTEARLLIKLAAASGFIGGKNECNTMHARHARGTGRGYHTFIQLNERHPTKLICIETFYS